MTSAMSPREPARRADASPTAHVRAEEVEVPARDGTPLAGTLYLPQADRGLAVLLNPATAVPRRYYDGFARFLAGRGLHVLTYDYRGIGGSRLVGEARRRARFQDWGVLDAPGAQDWLAARLPHHRPVLVGHSAGGQMLGLSEGVGRWRAVLLVGSQHGYLGHWRGLARARMALLWYVLVPATTALSDTFPGRRLGLADLPAGIARQWARWCRSPHYVSDAVGRPWRPFNAQLTAPLRLYSFSDDPIAPEAAARALLAYYPNTRAEHLHLTPAQLGCARVGHFGWFRGGMEAAWAEAADWLERAAAADTLRGPTETRAGAGSDG